MRLLAPFFKTNALSWSSLQTRQPAKAISGFSTFGFVFQTKSWLTFDREKKIKKTLRLIFLFRDWPATGSGLRGEGAKDKEEDSVKSMVRP